MPRGRRRDCPGALQHILARSIERRRFVHSDRGRRDFLDRLAAAPETAVENR